MKPSARSGVRRSAGRLVAAALVVAACHGCASVPNPDQRDPLESMRKAPKRVRKLVKGLGRKQLEASVAVR